MKPNTGITCTWSKSTTASGSLSAYEMRYTVDNGVSYTTVSTGIGANYSKYSFTPQAIDGQQVIVQIRARNSYNKYSSWGNFPTITVYTDGMSVAKISDCLQISRYRVTRVLKEANIEVINRQNLISYDL